MLLIYTFGVFVGPLEVEFGWSLAELSGALTALEFSTALAAPMYGYLIDRFGSRTIVLVSTALLALLVMSMRFMSGAVWQLYLIFAIIPFLTGGSSPVGYARLVVASFDRARGLALGLVMAGAGIGGAIMPLCAQFLIKEFGWRNSYLVLGGATMLLAVPICAHLFGRYPINDARSLSGSGDWNRCWEIIRSRVFLEVTLIFGLIGVVSLGLIAHFVPLIIQNGLTRDEAAGVSTIIGIAVVASRACVGFALDRVRGPTVLAVVISGSILVLGQLLWFSSLWSYILSALLIGLTVGAEFDILAYLISRYFPTALFGKLYGLTYGVFLIGCGIGPLMVARSFEKSQNYHAAMIELAIAAVLALALCFRLPATTPLKQARHNLKWCCQPTLTCLRGRPI